MSKTRFEVYNKDPGMIRCRDPLDMFQVESTSNRGIMGGSDNAAYEMVEKLVALLNDPHGSLSTGRYFVRDKTSFYDSGEIVRGKKSESNVGLAVVYTVTHAPDDGRELPDHMNIVRLVGLLNYADHGSPLGSSP